MLCYQLFFTTSLILEQAFCQLKLVGSTLVPLMGQLQQTPARREMAPMATLAPSVTNRDPKGLKFVSIVEAVYNRARLTEEEAQRVNETPGLAEQIAGFIADNRSGNRYADKVVRSYTYPPEYKGPKPIAEQIEMVGQVFGLDMAKTLDYATHLPELPEGAEGWFAIPSVDALARAYFSKVEDTAEQYCHAVLLILAQIKASRAFYNYRGQIDPSHLRMHIRTAQAMERIIEVQTGDILIIAAQLGLRHRGKSTRRARETFVASEYGLGSLAGGAITLTHPERFVRWVQLHEDLPGDEFSPSADGLFDRAPYLRFRDDGVEFGTDYVAYPGVNFGSASGFLPQSEA